MKYTFSVAFLFLAMTAFAQPANDDCSGLIDLGEAPICDSTLYNNVGATESNIGFDNFPPCFVGNPQRDVWFSFVASDTILDYRVLLTGAPDPVNGHPSILNPQIALYRGDCEFDGLQLLDCVSAAAGETTAQVDLIGLTPGITYFLRINDWSPNATPNAGSFQLCITEKPPITNITEGGSTLCSGTLVDSGGEDGDYGNNENHTFTICPSTPNNCINFTLQYFNLESGDFGFTGDVLTFYDGASTSAPQLAILNGAGSNNPSNGGVAYSVSASSGCLTIQFTSNGSTTFEGFLGTWQCTADACDTPQDIVVNSDATPEEIVQSVVAGQTVINVTAVNCDEDALGTFDAGPDSQLGLDKGLLLTSGSAVNVANPATFFTSSFTGGGNDGDLDYLSSINGNSSTSQDACIVEMEVFAATDEITFEYIFGSEEYPEYVNTSFNDIFAFLVSGPGIVGDPNIADQLNIATLPNGTFIQINSVNDGQNWQYYRNNGNSQTVAYDGLTSDSLGIKKSLTASVATIPCNTYKLKFAVADRGDSSFDSGVFISEIKGGSPQLGVNYQSGIEYLVEECTNTPDEIVVSLNAPIAQPATYDVIIGGNAVLGVDYELDIPGTLTFTTGTESFNFPVQALADGVTEGTDTIEIQLVRDFGCGSVVLASLLIEIQDQLDVSIFDDQLDTVLVCDGGCAQLQAEGAASYFWSPPGLLSNPDISNPSICPDTSLLVTVTGTLGICTDMDSVWVQLISPEVTILPDGNQTICATDTLVLEASNNIGNSNLQWTSFFVPLPDPTAPVQAVVPPPGFTNFTLNVSVSLAGCQASDAITITVDPFSFPTLAADTVICENYSVDLGSDIENSTTTFSWTPNLGLEPGTDVSGPVATPDVTTTYTLVATSSTGICKDSAEVTVTVIPADVAFENPDTTYLCLGDTVLLSATNSTGGDGVSWQAHPTLQVLSPETGTAAPTVSTWYYIQLETAQCMVFDSVLVYVDSLPLLDIMAIPDKESYCQGEQVTLVSPTYEPAHFPNIQHSWDDDSPGALTPDSFLNLVFLAQETNTYIRVTTVNACTSVDSIDIFVVPVASISIDPPQSTICPGDPVVFTVTADPGVTDFSWSPSNGLSCDDCTNPTATVLTTTTFSLDGEFMGCPVGASATITVSPAPAFSPPPNPSICPGEDITLNNSASPNATYTWTSSDGSLNSSAAQPVVSPLQTTTYYLVASNGICEREEEVTILVATDFTLSIPNDTILCSYSLVPLQAEVSAAGVQLTWTDETGAAVTPPYPAGDGGAFTLTAVSGEGCFVKEEVLTVDVHPDFNLDAGPDQVVGSGTPVTVGVTADLPGVTFSWTDGNGEDLGSGASVTLTLCSSDQVVVTGVDPSGCYIHLDTVNISVTAGFTVDSLLVSQSDTSEIIYEGEEISLDVYTTPSPLPGASYEWFQNGELIATTAAPTSGTINAPEILAEEEVFVYDVVVTDAGGCSSLFSVSLTVSNNPLDMPNIFTPNNDGLNDVFQPVSRVPVDILEFKVWNRWGQLVYEGSGSDAGWDGRQNEKPAPSDVYVYFVRYRILGGSGKEYSEKGDCTLLR
ncbi:MAG: hypothetical protein RLY31_596 [Bacteroidota bacterium]|jgi:gliding motility-associated-like protein